MAKRQQKVEVVSTDHDIFIVVNGVRVAKRGKPDSVQAGVWISLEPGWEVINDEKTLSIRQRGVTAH
jgi:hypothetical protein